tara:strand:- start:74 stop:277 length:204 start_codon:yes stop_codon:yes gene_type:complete
MKNKVNKLFSTKFLISILVILILLSLIFEFSKIIENKTNMDKDEEKELEERKKNVAKNSILINSFAD